MPVTPSVRPSGTTSAAVAGLAVLLCLLLGLDSLSEEARDHHCNNLQCPAFFMGN
jgi:hypothetical protein